jgi:RIO-like serine/threonine protein kinase
MNIIKTYMIKLNKNDAKTIKTILNSDIINYVELSLENHFIIFDLNNHFINIECDGIPYNIEYNQVYVRDNTLFIITNE